MIDLLTVLMTSGAPVPAPAETPPNLDWLGPVVTGFCSLIVGVVATIGLVYRRNQDRKDAVSDKQTDAEIAIQPKVTDGWEEVRAARAEATRYYKLYRAFEELFYTAFGALRHLVRDTRSVHPDQEFTDDVVDALKIVPPDTSDIK